MLLKRDNVISKDDAWHYHFNNHKTICFIVKNDRSIKSIGLFDPDLKNWYDVKGLHYMEELTLDDGELLNVDALLDLARREDE